MNSGQFLRCVRLIVILLTVALLLSCSGSSGGGDSSSNTDDILSEDEVLSEDEILSDSLTPGGYPDVAGNYSFTTQDFIYTCTDGGAGTFVGKAYNLEITQDENSIFATTSNIDEKIPGITIIEENQYSGTIQKNGSFLLNRSRIVSIEGEQGIFWVSYSINGIFTDTGWSGDYEYKTTSQYDGISCTSKTTFYGDKLILYSKSMQSTEMQDSNDEILIDILGAF